MGGTHLHILPRDSVALDDAADVHRQPLQLRHIPDRIKGSCRYGIEEAPHVACKCDARQANQGMQRVSGPVCAVPLLTPSAAGLL